MNGRRLFLTLALAGAPALCVQAADGWQTVRPGLSARPVKNPDNGLAFMPGLQPVSDIPAWVLDACSIAYFRLNWCDVTDAAGRPKFDELDRKYFAGYRAKGLRLSFRIMAANPHATVEDVTPKAILGRGIPTVKHVSVSGKPQRNPVFWDESFVVAYNELTRALGAYLDGQPWAGPVDLGGMGDWGEMHLKRWTAKQLDETGYTQERYLRAVTAMMDEMDRSLPRVTKAFCVVPDMMPEPGPVFAALVDRATRRGWWLRSDGCQTSGPPPYVVPYAERLWTRVGLICEPNGAINNSGSTGEDSAKTWLDANLRAHASILNLMGLWDLSRFTVDEMRDVQLAATRTGARLTIEEAVLPAAAIRSEGGAGWLAGSLTLAQRGSAPYHGSVHVRLMLAGAGPAPVVQAVLPDPPLARLLPGETQRVPFLLSLPAGTSAAPLTVRVALHDPDRGPLETGNEPLADGGWLKLGAVAAAAKPLPPLFDLATGRLDPAVGVSASRSAEGLILTGTASGWSYAAAAHGTPVDPKRLYVLRVRVRARLGKIPGSALYFKLGINDAKGGWAGNVNTPHYDVAAPWTWQELTAVYRPRAEDGTFMLAAEKGRTAPSDVDAELGAWTVHAVPVP